MKGFIRSLARGKPQSQALMRQRIRLSAKAIQVDGATGVGFGTAVIGDFPDGNILIFGAVAYLQFTKAAAASGIQAAFDGDFSIGTTATADATLSTTDANIIASTALGAATAGVSPVVRGVSAVPAVATVLDNTDGSLELNLNLIIDDTNISADDQDLTVTGYVDISYAVMGDD
jgi:hypothetical protein